MRKIHSVSLEERRWGIWDHFSDVFLEFSYKSTAPSTLDEWRALCNELNKKCGSTLGVDRFVVRAKAPIIDVTYGGYGAD